MDFNPSPTTYSAADLLEAFSRPTQAALMSSMAILNATSNATLADVATAAATSTVSAVKNSTPNFGKLTLLVFEAVLEVVCVSAPGYLLARLGMFDGAAQKFVANLNITLFTPCLIFSKLAAQLSPDKFADLIIIPFILITQTLISWAISIVACRVFRLKKKPQVNFVTAMSVFGNSNSLPLSLIVSLSKTISGLHWDKIPGDNDNEVAARGILYLLVFSQLGQALRWSWGMNALLKPLEYYKPDELSGDEASESFTPYRDSPPASPLITPVGYGDRAADAAPGPDDDDVEASSSSADEQRPLQTRLRAVSNGKLSYAPNGQSNPKPTVDSSDAGSAGVNRSWWQSARHALGAKQKRVAGNISRESHRAFDGLPAPMQTGLKRTGKLSKSLWERIVACLNPPLIAILLAVVVASIPPLQRLFFTPHTFINNSVTRAIGQSGGVAVPLILVVLGANLEQSTLPDADVISQETQQEEKRMLVAALLSRMLFTIAIMAPILALIAKFVPVSILGDPIFIVVCFLLAGAPSALQLAQMCQVNGVFVKLVSTLLFWSYVILILPSTLMLVVMALEVVNLTR